MNIVEMYYGPERRVHPDAPPAEVTGNIESFIKVEVSGHIFAAKTVHQGLAAYRGSPPAKFLLRQVQDKVMNEIRKELFGG